MAEQYISDVMTASLTCQMERFPNVFIYFVRAPLENVWEGEGSFTKITFSQSHSVRTNQIYFTASLSRYLERHKKCVTTRVAVLKNSWEQSKNIFSTEKSLNFCSLFLF